MCVSRLTCTVDRSRRFPGSPVAAAAVVADLEEAGFVPVGAPLAWSWLVSFA